MRLKPVFYRAASFLWRSAPSHLRARLQNEVAFVAVHGVHRPEWADAIRPPSSSLMLRDLEKNLCAVSRSYSVISIDEGTDMLAGRIPLRPRCVVLTFDDSLKSHLELVAPLLVRLGIPATFYLSTDAIDSRQPYWWLRVDYAVAKSRQAPEVATHIKRRLRDTPARERDAAVDALEESRGVRLQDNPGTFPFAEILTWNDARRLQQMGLTIGSHTVTHPNLTLLSEDELAYELRESKDQLEVALGVPCRHCCFPYGRYTTAVCDMAQTTGYVSAVTSEGPGWNVPTGSSWKLRRFAMPGEPYKLPYILSGLEASALRLRRS